MTTTHTQLRDARDRLIDLLGFGQTYPLRDLAVNDDQLTVAFNTSAKIPIENSQQGVLYQLQHGHMPVEQTASGTKGAGQPIEAEGNGETLILETYKIEDDITFEILARKTLSDQKAYLHQTATVKVGLDVSLKAWIKGEEYLDPSIENPKATTPRIIDYGNSVTVIIKDSQEGVDYRLVYFKETEAGQAPEEIVLSIADVRGTLNNIRLSSQAVTEDIDIRIRATKTFDPSENRPTQTALLNTTLPLKVRANPALNVSVDPAPIIDYQQSATIKIANAQASASYHLYLYPIPDRDFMHQPASETEVIKISVPNETDAQIRKPARSHPWATPAGYTAWGTPQQGVDGEIQFTLDPLSQDTLIIIQAKKVHQDSPTLSSAVQLEQAAVVLTRPNPAPALNLAVIMAENKTNGQLYVFDGQAGVFYYFRLSPDGDNLSLPAYFHKRDEQDDSINKGLNQLTIGVDYVIARPLIEGANRNLAKTAPETPILETDPLPADTTLYIHAIKAQTRVANALTQTAQIATLPEISLEKSVVSAGESTKILVTASIEGDKYQPFLNDVSIRRARNGNGDNLSFSTDAITEDSDFELRITRPEETSIVVERIVKLSVKVET